MADEIRELKSADARAVIQERIQKGDWRFFGCYSDEPQGMYFPGLTKEEIKKYVDSGLYDIEVYFDHRIVYQVQFECDTRPWEKAKWSYAERMNRELLKQIRESGRPNKRPEGTSGEFSPSKSSQVPGVPHP